MAPTDHVLLDLNDNVIEFAPGHFLTDALTGLPIPNATVTVLLQDSAGGVVMPVKAMLPVVGESGNYRANIPADTVYPSQSRVIAILTADDGPEARGAWGIHVAVQKRR